jgi:sugar diacid utilization regulator
MLARLLVPVRWHGELLGSVVVIDADESLTGAEVTLVADFAREVAGLIVAERHAADERALADEEDTAAWLGSDPAARQRGQAGLSARGLLPDLTHVRVLVARPAVDVTTDGSRTHLALRHAFGVLRGRVRGTALTTVRADHGTVALVAPGPVRDEQAQDAAQVVRNEVRDVLGDACIVHVGIGTAVTGVGLAWLSRRQADLAIRAVPVLGSGPVVRWEALGPLQLLLRIPANELDETAVPREVATLVAADPEGRLTDTLEAYLRSGGAGSATAKALHIHRTTLYYRLDRVREVTGLDIDDGEIRLLLHLGLLTHRMAATRG